MLRLRRAKTRILIANYYSCNYKPNNATCKAAIHQRCAGWADGKQTDGQFRMAIPLRGVYMRPLRTTLEAYYIFQGGGQPLRLQEGGSHRSSVLWGQKCTKFIFGGPHCGTLWRSPISFNRPGREVSLPIPHSIRRLWHLDRFSHFENFLRAPTNTDAVVCHP